MPKAPASSWLSKNDIHFVKQSPGTIVSGLRNKIYFPLAKTNAKLFALAKPVFFSFHINLTSLNLPLKNCLLLSVELLSTTKISASTFFTAFVTEHRHCSKKNFTL